MNYQDEWSRWHSKPTDGHNYSTNNGWIYSAYSKYLLRDTERNLDYGKLYLCLDKCTRSLEPLKIDRSPNDPTPPISKDEIIGLVSLSMLKSNDLKLSYWNYCNLPEYTQKPLSLVVVWKAIRAGIIRNSIVRKLKLTGGSKRNYYWENRMIDLYPLAFRLAPWEIYYVKEMSNETPTFFEELTFYLHYIQVILSGNKSTRMMLWLMLKDLRKNNMLRFVNMKKYVTTYFGKEHPFTKNL